MERAAAVVAELPAEVGLDLETMTRGPLEQPWLVITKDGKRAVRQPEPDDAPLDPFRGQPRLISIYDPARRTTFIFDVVKLGGCPAGLLERRVVGHNLLFDLAMLGAQGLAPASSIDTLQLAAMHLAPGKRRLAHVAEQFLGITLPKALATSNWAAPELSTAQLAYAGADPAVAYLAGKRMHAALDQRERTAFAVANRAVPAIVRMRLRGLPFDPEVHRQVIDGWQQEFALRRAEFEQITGSPAPLSSNCRARLADRAPVRGCPAALAAHRERPAVDREGRDQAHGSGLAGGPAAARAAARADAHRDLRAQPDRPALAGDRQAARRLPVCRS